MSNATTKRQSVKAAKEAGATIVQILHPHTLEADPSSLMPTNEALTAAFLAGDRKVIANLGTSNLKGQIQADLANAAYIYEVFEIDSEDEEAQTLLSNAIDAYESTSAIKDTTELNKEIILATVQALKSGAVSATNIKNSYVRSSAIAGVISLEKLADYLGVSYTGETTDTALADLVKVALSS